MTRPPLPPPDPSWFQHVSNCTCKECFPPTWWDYLLEILLVISLVGAAIAWGVFLAFGVA